MCMAAYRNLKTVARVRVALAGGRLRVWLDMEDTGEFQPCQFGWGLADAAQFSSELDQLAQRRDRGEVWVAPLAEVAAYIKQASSITVRAFLSTDADNKPTIRCWVKRTREPQHPMPLAPYTVELPIPEPWRPEEFQQVQFHDEGSSEGLGVRGVGGTGLINLNLNLT